MDDERCSACSIKLLPGEAEKRDGQLLCATCADRGPAGLAPETYSCKCGQSFSNSQSLASHVSRAHGKPRADRGRRGGARMKMTEEGAAKTFQCKHHGCGQTFSSQAAFAGHVGGHKRAGSRRSSRPASRARRPGPDVRFKCRHCGAGFEALHEISAHVRAAHGGRGPQREASSGTEQIPCPMCARPLPPGAALVTKEFIREGVDEERAARLTAIAYGMLHVPGRPS